MNYQDVVEPHRRKLAAAEARVNALEKELDSARGVVVTLKRNLVHVAETVEKCQAVAAADKRIPKLSNAVRRWLIKLAEHEVFGPVEAELIAKESGETITGAAIRQRLKQLTDIRGLEKRGRGNYSVDRGVCGDLLGIDWEIEGQTEVERAALLDRADLAQVDTDNRLSEDREASRLSRLQAEDRSLNLDYDVPMPAWDQHASIDDVSDERDMFSLIRDASVRRRAKHPDQPCASAPLRASLRSAVT